MEKIPLNNDKETNFHRLSDDKRELRKILKDLGVNVSTKEIKEDPREEDSRLVNLLKKFRQKTVGFITKKDNGHLDITGAKERLKSDEKKEKLRIDYEEINSLMGSDFSKLDELFKREKEVKKQILKRIIKIKNKGLDSDLIVSTLNEELKSLNQSLTSIRLSSPTLSRAHSLLSYKEQLSKPGGIIETPTVSTVKEAIENALITGSPTLLHGPTGTGKTTLAIKASYELNGKMPEVVNCNPETKQRDIWGGQGLKVKEGTNATETVDIYGPLSKAMREGNVCIFDEFTNLPEGQLVFIKGIVNKKPGERVYVPGNGEIVIQQGYQLICTANLKSEKNKEKQAMPPEVANEFGQNNIFVDYQSKEESYDIAVSRLLNKDGSVDFSRYDLEETIPQFVKAMRDIQDAYTSEISQERATELKLPYQLNLPPKLKKMVLNQRTVSHILETYKVDRLKNKDISFKEYLDQRLKKELTFTEYPIEDRILIAKLLSAHGLLTTLTDKELNLPDKTLLFTQTDQFKKKTEEQIQKSKQIEHINLKDLSNIDPFNSKGIDARQEAGDLDKQGQQTNPDTPKTPETIQNPNLESFLLDTYKGWGVEKDKLDTIKWKGEEISPSQIDYNQMKDDTDQSKYGEYILNPDCRNIDWSKIDKSKIKVIELSSLNNKKLAEVMEYLKTNYPQSQYTYPDLSYHKYLYENQTDIPEQLKINKWQFFPGSLFRRSAGHWDVPFGGWGSVWGRGGSWLGNDWDDYCRVVLLEK